MSAVDWNVRYLNNDMPWDRGQASPFLQHVLPTLVREKSILIPGCGQGHEIALLASLRFNVTGLDIAPEAIRLAQERLDSSHLEAQLELTDVLTWSAPEPFDYVYEQTCLCALPPQHWETYGGQLKRWIKPGGYLIVAFMQTQNEGGPPFHCALDRMKELFSDLDWTWPSEPFHRWDHPRGFHELGAILQRT